MENEVSMGDQFLSIINQIIEDNLDNENFSVEVLAQKAGFSRSMLHRKIKKLTGISASDLITEIRLNHAKKLLENDVATVSEIAYRVGFKNPSYFNRVFKKHFKISPGNVKKSYAVNQSTISTDQKPEHSPENREILSSAKLKRYRLLLKALIILIIIIVASGVVYYLFDLMRYAEKSIAVLPLHNLTGLPENDYFVDGMHDALIGKLGQIKSIRVISRTSTLSYRNSEMLLHDIAKELGVNTIVEGSVLGVGDSLMVLIQLIDVFPKERHLLSNEYNDDLQNVLTIQTSVVEDIAKEISIKLSKDEEQLLARSNTVNPETYKSYLRGMYYINQGTEESFEKGITYLVEAIDRDPADPFAYAGLALGYALRGHGQIFPEESFRSATAAANKALRIDPTMDEAHTALALIYLYQYGDWSKAKEAFEYAIANSPNNEIAHAHLAWYYVLFGNKKSIYHANKAVEIDPLLPSYKSWLAWIYFINNEYDQAEFWAKKSLELQENLPNGNMVLGWVYLEKKQYKEAIEVHEKLPDNHVVWKTIRCRTYILTGNKKKALAIWNELEAYSEKNFVNPFYTGMIAGMLGYTDNAFNLLNEACDNNYFPVNYIEVWPGVEFIRNDPRYKILLQKMNLPYRGAIIAEQK
ncbi:helix-turn-helix domain-containing protein [Bacteroidota bacterium]